jgi:hypothetical protein
MRVRSMLALTRAGSRSTVNARLLRLAAALMVVREGLAADVRPAAHVTLQNLAPLCNGVGKQKFELNVRTKPV